MHDSQNKVSEVIAVAVWHDSDILVRLFAYGVRNFKLDHERYEIVVEAIAVGNWSRASKLNDSMGVQGFVSFYRLIVRVKLEVSLIRMSQVLDYFQRLSEAIQFNFEDLINIVIILSKFEC